MKKVLALAAALAMIMAMATACGNSEASSQATLGSSTEISDTSSK